MTDWKKIYEEFDKLTGEEVNRLEDVFKAVPKERLSGYFLANPYAKKVFEEKLKLKVPPVTPVCPKCGGELKELTRVPIFIKDPLRLTAEEEYTRAERGIPLPTTHMELIEVPPTMKVWRCEKCEALFERDARGRLIERFPEFVYRKILREWRAIEKRVAPPTPAVPTVRPPTRPPTALKPPAIGPIPWRRYVKKIDDVTWWKKMTAEERKKIDDEYLRLVEEYRKGGVE